MLPVVHVVVSIGIAFALEINYSRKYSMILLLGFLGLLPDIDHFLPSYNGVGIFHNLIALGVLPIVVLMVAFMVQNSTNSNSSKFQRFIIAATVVLLGHLILDLVSGGTIYLNIFSENGTFQLESFPLLKSTILGTVIEIKDIAWLALGAVVLFGNLAQKQIYAKTEGFEEYDRLSKQTRVSRKEILRSIISRPVRNSRTHLS